MSDDTPKHPLIHSPELKAKLQREWHLGEDLQPLTDNPLERAAQLKANEFPTIPLTKAERRIALTKELKMEPTKPGVKTSEFWLQLLAGLAIAVIAFTLDHGLPAIAEGLGGLGVVGSVLLVLVPVVKMGLGWLLQRLSSNYSAARTEVKVAAATAPKG